MRYFVFLAAILIAQNSFADCPNLEGSYVALEHPHQTLSITQNGCNSITITEDRWPVEGLVDGRKHHEQKLEWVGTNSLVETDYYIFGNKADQQIFVQNADLSISLTILDGHGRVKFKFTFKKVTQ